MAFLDYAGLTRFKEKLDSVFLKQHQTIKQDGVTGATGNRYAVCSTAAGTADKTATITNGTFTLENGSSVYVYFQNMNTASNPTLNINGTGAHYITDSYSTGTGASNVTPKRVNGYCHLIYIAGTSNMWVLVSSSTYSDQMDRVEKLRKGLAIVSEGNTHDAVAKGQYVYVHSHSSVSEGLYKATSAIALNGTLSSSNLSAVSNGLGGEVASLSDQIAKQSLSITPNQKVTFDSNNCWSVGDTVTVSFIGKLNADLDSSDGAVLTLPYNTYKRIDVPVVFTDGSTGSLYCSANSNALSKNYGTWTNGKRFCVNFSYAKA